MDWVWEEHQNNYQSRCCMDVAVLLDCWTSIHVGQGTCSPSKSLLQCVFLRLAALTSLLVAYPKFLFGVISAATCSNRDWIDSKYGWGAELCAYHELCGVMSLLACFGFSFYSRFSWDPQLDDPEDLKKSKGSGKTGSLGDRTMRELSLEDWDTPWNYMKLLWQL